jgi:starch synthase (maltosyl-transferring)
VDLARIGIDLRRPYDVHDLLTDARYTWNGPRNYVQLEPGIAHIFAVTQAPATAPV